MVLEIRTHPDKGRGGGLKIRDFGGRPLQTAPNLEGHPGSYRVYLSGMSEINVGC